MRPPLTFFCAGVAKPAGSKRGFFIPKLKRVVIVDANPNSKDWKTDVRHAAQEALGDLGMWCGPLAVRFEFFIARPKSHFRTGKNAHLLRDSAPTHPTGKPDALKLARGVEDAMTAVIYQDDAQIVEETILKRWGGTPGVRVYIKEANYD